MVNCAIIGATGYTGLELARILLRHSYVRLTALTTRQSNPIGLRELMPQLPTDLNLEIRQYSDAELKKSADVFFLCLPHTEAAATAKKFYQAGKCVIDLSADLRLKNASLYKQWYGFKHAHSTLLKKSVYGLPELNRKKIKSSDLIANPGCYPTASVLAVAPALKARLIKKDSVVINASSGVSGAGKKLSDNKQFYELGENYYAYKVGLHQHTPEIEQALGEVAGSRVGISFVTHLLAVKRGILATVQMKAQSAAAANRIRKVYEEFYADEPFVRILPQGSFPELKAVTNTNFCDIGIFTDAKSGRVIIISAIDNLVKGASGQAVQNLNIRMGYPEDEGLRSW